MTGCEFWACLEGQDVFDPVCGPTSAYALRDEAGQRLAHVVADALRSDAADFRQRGRRDVAARLTHIAGEISCGGRPSRKALERERRRLELIAGRLCVGR